jgi:hypothetical protein
MGNKYIVGVVRIGYSFHDIEVEADNEDMAQERALSVAGNYEYTEKHSEYEVDTMEEKQNGQDEA